MTFRDLWVDNPIYIDEIDEDIYEQIKNDAEDYYDSLDVE